MNNEKHFFLLFKYICLKAGKHEIGRFGIYCFFLYLSIEGLDLINQRNEATFMCFRK